MRLVISLIPVKKIAFWDGRRSRSHGIDFSSPQFILITHELGLGRRLSPSGTCMIACVYPLSFTVTEVTSANIHDNI